MVRLGPVGDDACGGVSGSSVRGLPRQGSAPAHGSGGGDDLSDRPPAPEEAAQPQSGSRRWSFWTKRKPSPVGGNTANATSTNVEKQALEYKASTLAASPDGPTGECADDGPSADVPNLVPNRRPIKVHCAPPSPVLEEFDQSGDQEFDYGESDGGETDSSRWQASDVNMPAARNNGLGFGSPCRAASSEQSGRHWVFQLALLLAMLLATTMLVVLSVAPLVPTGGAVLGYSRGGPASAAVDVVAQWAAPTAEAARRLPFGDSPEPHEGINLEWQVTHRWGVGVRASKVPLSDVLYTRPQGAVLVGRREGDWLRLWRDAGWVRFTMRGVDLVVRRNVSYWLTEESKSCSSRGGFSVNRVNACQLAALRLGLPAPRQQVAPIEEPPAAVAATRGNVWSSIGDVKTAALASVPMGGCFFTGGQTHMEGPAAGEGEASVGGQRVAHAGNVGSAAAASARTVAAAKHAARMQASGLNGQLCADLAY